MKVISYNKEQGTATVELFGQTRELKASFYGDHMNVFGIAVKYPTGKRVWGGSFSYYFASGHINNIHTPMDHRARLARVDVVGFLEDFRKKTEEQK